MAGIAQKEQKHLIVVPDISTKMREKFRRAKNENGLAKGKTQ